MTNKVHEQILTIRNTGLTNMFDVNTVQRMAREMNFFELVVFLKNIRTNTSALSSQVRNSRCILHNSTDDICLKYRVVYARIYRVIVWI